MSRSTLARQRMFGRTSAEGGGGGSTGEGQQQNQQQGNQTGGTDSGAGSGQKTEATDDEGNKLGFPADTPTADMTAEERANYWRNQSKKHQKALPKNLAELQEKAQKWDDYQKSQQTPEQQAASQQQQAESDRIKREAGANAAETSLRAILQTNGKKTDEIDDLLGIVDFTRFLTDDHKVDTAKVTAYVNRVAPGKGGGTVDLGQGKQGEQPGSRGDAGKAAATARFGNRSGQQSPYGALSRRS